MPKSFKQCFPLISGESASNCHVIRVSQVKIHYTIEGETQVIATISANVAILEFLYKDLPGQPKNYKIVRIESTDGTELTDLKAPPPDTVYIVGVRT